MSNLFSFLLRFRVLNVINHLVIHCVILITQLIFLLKGPQLTKQHNSLSFPLLYFISGFFSPFLFLIFQHLRCSGSLKHPWGLRVRAFVSHFLLKQFFFNPMWLFTVVVLALSSPSLFLLSFSPSHPHHPPSVFSVSARGQCYTFFFCMREGRGYLFSFYNLKIEKKMI